MAFAGRVGLTLVAALCVVWLAPGCAKVRNPKLEIRSQKSGLFEDVAERVGVHFRHTNGARKRHRFIQQLGGGCAFLDYDADGFQDALLLSCGELDAPPETAPLNLALFHNNRNGTFTNVTQGSGLDKPLGYAQSLAVGDYDNDGLPDVFVAGYPACYLFRNATQRGAGFRRTEVRTPASRQDVGATLFRDVTKSSGLAVTEKGLWASGAAWGDYDKDGLLDLCVIHYAPPADPIDKVCSRPGIGAPGYCSPHTFRGDAPRLYHNEGSGRFREVTQSAGLHRMAGRSLAVAWLDYDEDDDQDLFVVNDLHRNFLFRNDEGGAFTEVAVPVGVAYGAGGRPCSGMGIGLGDYDHSGRESAFIPNLELETFSFFRGEGRGVFSYATENVGLSQATMGHSGWGVAFLDYDRDGWLDLVTANGGLHEYVPQDGPGSVYKEPKGLYRNTGRGVFVDVSDQSGDMTTPRAGRGLAVGDYDNDGRLDVLCVNRYDRAELFRNGSRDRNHWLSLRLVGVKSNRDGAGAKVWVTANGVRQYAQCRCNSSYASTSDKRLLFGLGKATRVDKLEIRWLSGQRDVYADLPANRFYVLTEGKACVVEALNPSGS
jgi:hypothetical protein